MAFNDILSFLTRSEFKAKLQKTMTLKHITLFSAVLTSSLISTAQDSSSSNYVREYAEFVAEKEFGTDGEIDVFATENNEDDSGSPVAVPFDDFKSLLETAYDEGRGGVVTFDIPFYGGAYRDYDRTKVRQFIEGKEDEFLANGQYEDQRDRQNKIENWRQEAVDAGVVDFSLKRPVLNRKDSGVDEAGQTLPLSEDIQFEHLRVRFGKSLEKSLRIKRGPQFYVEGALASFEYPASEDLESLTNDNHYFQVGQATYSGDGAPVPISLPFSLNSGMTDLVFDQRDNVIAVGFTMLSVNNFQYWQGLGGEPDRPNNLQIVVEFSDGSEEELFSTTAQSKAGHDTFFAMEAPDGLSIMRLWVRVVGRNWRTFTFMDDLAFITEKTAPYLASEDQYEGVVGEPFYAPVEVGQEPDTVTIENLPAGIEYNGEWELLEGTFEVAGEFAANVVLENEIGSTETTIHFTVEEELPEQLQCKEDDNSCDPSIEVVNPGQVSTLLRRQLSGVELFTSYDELISSQDKKFFTRIRKADASGEFAGFEDSQIEISQLALSLTPDSVQAEPFPDHVGKLESFSFDEEAGRTQVVISELGGIPPGDGLYVLNLQAYILDQDNDGEPEEDNPENRKFLESLVIEEVTEVSKTEGNDSSYSIQVEIPVDLSNEEIKFLLPDGSIVDELSEIVATDQLIGLVRNGIGVIGGTPIAGSTVGLYEMNVYVRTPYSCGMETFLLEILPPVVLPNINGDKTTDYLIHIGDSVYAMENSLRGEGAYDTFELAAAPVVEGINPDEEIFLGDFNGDNQTDLLGWNQTEGYVRQYRTDVPGESVVESTLLDSMIPDTDGSRFSAMAGDFNADLVTDLYWVDRENERFSVWLMARGSFGQGGIGWAGHASLRPDFLELVAVGDITGDGNEVVVAKLSDNGYSLMQLTKFEGTGEMEFEEVTFNMDDRYVVFDVVDINNDGFADLLWENRDTGAISYWPMQGLERDTPYFQKGDRELEDGTTEEVPLQDADGRYQGKDGEILWRGGTGWSLVTAIDISGDKFADLIVRNASTGSFAVQQMQANEVVGVLEPIGMEGHELVQVGDLNGDEVQDLLFRDSGSGRLTIVGAPVIEPSGGAEEDEEVLLELNQLGLNIIPIGRLEANGTFRNPYFKRNEVPEFSIPFPWLGEKYFYSQRWMYAEEWGWLYFLAETGADAAWFMDPTLGIIWISGASYPNLFQERNQFWLRFVEGTDNPRMFFNYLFGFEMSENEL